MSIERLLATIHLTRSILVDEQEVWFNSNVERDVTQELRRALRRHRRGVKLLLHWSDISTCPTVDAHRPYWRYAGNGRYVCDACEKIAV